MPFLRWAKEQIQAILDDIARKNQSEANLNSNQNSTMNMLSDKLGAVQSSINDMIALATFDASQTVSGTFSTSRIPTQDFSKISGGSASVAGLTTSGNATVNGHVYVPNSTLASFGSWTIAYIDGDGRLTRGASSARFKVDIVPEPMGADYFQAELKEFAMKGGNGWRVLGYIAEDLVGTDMERFVVWERYEGEDGERHVLRDVSGQPVPLSIDWIPLLLAQNTQIKRELADTTDRLEAIEARIDALEEK